MGESGVGVASAARPPSADEEAARRLMSVDTEFLVLDLRRRTGRGVIVADDLAGVLEEAPLDSLVAEVRRRSRAGAPTEPLGWSVVIGWLRAEAAAAAANPEWAGGQDHPDAVDRVADQLDDLLSAAEVYVAHVREAGGGQVPGPGTSKLEALEAALDPGTAVVPRGTSGDVWEAPKRVAEELHAAAQEAVDHYRARITTPLHDFSRVEELREAKLRRRCVAIHGRDHGTCGAPVEPDAEGDLCPRHQDDAADIGRALIGLLRTIRYSQR